MRHTDAIILAKLPWLEADWMVLALTPDVGKVRLRAQGARKHGAKLQGHIEPGMVSRISFVAGKNGYRLTTARLERAFPRIAASFVKSQARHAIIQTLSQNLLEDHEGAAVIHGLALKTFDALESAESEGDIVRLVLWFHMRLLGALGLLPPLDTPEARNAGALIRLASVSSGDALAGATPVGVLVQEFSWLSRSLGVPLFLPRAPTPLPSAI